MEGNCDNNSGVVGFYISNKMPKPVASHSFEFVDTWLRGSGNLPLSLSITVGKHPDDAILVFALFFCFVPRWHHIRWRIESDEAIRFVPSVMVHPGPASQLESQRYGISKRQSIDSIGFHHEFCRWPSPVLFGTSILSMTASRFSATLRSLSTAAWVLGGSLSAQPVLQANAWSDLTIYNHCRSVQNPACPTSSTI
jgi:hypothetical protein